METKKIEELLTVDNIRDAVHLINEVCKMEIEPKILHKINGILEGRDVVLERMEDVVVFDDDGFSTGLVIELSFNLDNYFQELTLDFENTQEDKDNEQLIYSWRVVENTIKTKSSIKKQHDMLSNEIVHYTISEIIEIANSYQMALIVDMMITDNFVESKLQYFRAFVDEGIKPNVKFVQNFCDANDISLEIKNILTKIAFLYGPLSEKLIILVKGLFIQNTNFNEILECYGDWFSNDANRNLIGIKPQKNGFLFHLVDNVVTVNDTWNDELLKKQLVRYVNLEVVKMRNLWQEIEEEQQTLIDITPQQTLSIETTTATVEEGVILTHREIATLCYLNGLKNLTYPQAEELALFHGQKSRTSGKRLKEQYWKVIENEEGMNHKYNAEIYTHSNSYQSILKIIPLLEKEECIKLAEEYLKKSQPYKDVKSREY